MERKPPANPELVWTCFKKISTIIPQKHLKVYFFHRSRRFKSLDRMWRSTLREWETIHFDKKGEPDTASIPQYENAGFRPVNGNMYADLVRDYIVPALISSTLKTHLASEYLAFNTVRGTRSKLSFSTTNWVESRVLKATRRFTAAYCHYYCQRKLQQEVRSHCSSA